VSRVQRPAPCITRHFGDEFLQAMDCTGTDIQTCSNQEKMNRNENRKKLTKDKETNWP